MGIFQTSFGIWQIFVCQSRPRVVATHTDLHECFAHRLLGIFFFHFDDGKRLVIDPDQRVIEILDVFAGMS